MQPEQSKTCMDVSQPHSNPDQPDPGSQNEVDSTIGLRLVFQTATDDSMPDTHRKEFFADQLAELNEILPDVEFEIGEINDGYVSREHIEQEMRNAAEAAAKLLPGFELPDFDSQQVPISGKGLRLHRCVVSARLTIDQMVTFRVNQLENQFGEHAIDRQEIEKQVRADLSEFNRQREEQLKSIESHLRSMKRAGIISLGLCALSGGLCGLNLVRGIAQAAEGGHAFSAGFNFFSATLIAGLTAFAIRGTARFYEHRRKLQRLHDSIKNGEEVDPNLFD